MLTKEHMLGPYSLMQNGKQKYCAPPYAISILIGFKITQGTALSIVAKSYVRYQNFEAIVKSAALIKSI